MGEYSLFLRKEGKKEGRERENVHCKLVRKFPILSKNLANVYLDKLSYFLKVLIFQIICMPHLL